MEHIPERHFRAIQSFLNLSETMTGTQYFANQRIQKKLEKETMEEQIVLDKIEKSEKKGVWIRDLQDTLGMGEDKLRKILMALESKRLIKTMKMMGTSRKYYILYDIDPDSSDYLYSYKMDSPFQCSCSSAPPTVSLLEKMKETKKIGRFVASNVVIIKNALDDLFPLIPCSLKGGVKEFDSHFLKLIDYVAQDILTSDELYSKSLATFRIVVKLVRPVSRCAPVLRRIQMKNPELFDPLDPY